MTNPFKKIAPALLLRGALFTLLGLLLLAQALPALINVELSLDLSSAVFGAGLLAFGVVDIVHGMKRMARIMPRRTYLPLPYTGALDSTLIAF